MNKEKKSGYWFSPCINCGQMPTVEEGLRYAPDIENRLKEIIKEGKDGNV